LQRLLSILLWSAIAAAFVGPGTVTTCAAAGAGHGAGLLWALAFSAFGCFVLQEAAARVTLATGNTLAEALGGGGRRSGAVAAFLVSGAILLGCAAYQAGNVVGAVVGAELGTGLPRFWLTVAVSLGAAALLASGGASTVARTMAWIVAAMGVSFLWTALHVPVSSGALLIGVTLPQVPDGAGLLVVALVGTTIVPYNLFLGSRLATDQRLSEIRTGLLVAVGLGGLISMAILVVGTSIEGAFSFEALTASLEQRLGAWARTLFAVGLFSAGFSSAVTAPLAAAITAQGLFGRAGDRRWSETGAGYRGVWLGVVGTGLAFGLSQVRPVPLILIAQAFNGLLLPIVAGFLLIVVNDRHRMGTLANGAKANGCLALVFAVTVVLGLSNVLRAGAGALGLPAPSERWLFVVAGVLAAALTPTLLVVARRPRT
jgi:manganese transport protein